MHMISRAAKEKNLRRIAKISDPYTSSLVSVKFHVLFYKPAKFQIPRAPRESDAFLERENSFALVYLPVVSATLCRGFAVNYANGLGSCAFIRFLECFK